MLNRLKLSKSLMMLIIISFVCVVKSATAQYTKTIFSDDFNGSSMNNTLWHIPTWTGPTDGTYVGRTQFRCAQNAKLPTVSNGNAIINLETYNPTGFSLYGTDLISNRTFSRGAGLIFTIKAKMQAPIAGGIVGGIFTYENLASGRHDEIDFELVTNQLDYVHNNVYSNQSLGVGTPDSSKVTAPITDYHVYVIKWLPTSVEWYVDGILVRTSTKLVPANAMHFHLNMWGPAADWKSAYNADLQPTSSISSNKIFSMLVESVKVDSLISTPPLSTDATLKNLVITQGTLAPVFASSTVSYTDLIANDISYVTVVPTVNESNATVKVNNVLVTSETASSPMFLNIGDNAIYVIVTAQDGITTKTYTIIAKRDSPVLVETKEAAKLIFFPNPAHANIYFSNSEEINVSLYNSEGKLLLIKKVRGKLPIDFLSPGLYFIKYAQKDIKKTEKIIVF